MVQCYAIIGIKIGISNLRHGFDALIYQIFGIKMVQSYAIRTVCRTLYQAYLMDRLRRVV